MKTWATYLRLQTAYAYGGASGPGPDPVPGDGVERSLVIGPGHLEELKAWRNLLSGDLHVLTAEAGEIAVLDGKLGGLVLTLGDMHDMPYETGAFSFVAASNVLEHALAPYIALTECRRVLRDTGRATFVLPSFDGAEGGRGPFHLHCLTEPVWRELLRKTGFEVTETYVQVGGYDPSAHYVHYRCAAAAPPHPHDKIRAEIIVLKRTP